MDTTTVGELAAATGVSRPTIRRALQRRGLRSTGGGSLRAVSPEDAASIIATVGVTPHVDGLSKAEVQALAALARAPRGFASARALARSTGSSPTTAAKVLRHLVDIGLVVAERRMLAEGRPVEATVWRLDVTDRRWLAIAATVSSTVPPARPPLPPPPSTASAVLAPVLER